MGKRGPKPMPPAIRRLRDAVRGKKTKLSAKDKARVEPPVAAPDVPDSVARSPVAAQLWRKLTKELVRMKVIAKDDSIALEGLCIAYARAVEADEEVLKYGITLASQYGIKANPAVYISRQAWTDVRKFAHEFGLTPSGRRNAFEMPPLPADTDAETKELVEGKVTAEKFLFGGKLAGSIKRVG